MAETVKNLSAMAGGAGALALYFCFGFGGCHKAAPPAGNYYGALTSTAVWPHTGSGVNARLNAPITIGVVSPNGRGPAGTVAVQQAADAWSKATGNRVVFTVTEESEDAAAGADIRIYLSASLAQSLEPGKPVPTDPDPTVAYTNDYQPTATTMHGTMVHADTWVYGFDTPTVLPGVIGHELGRGLGIVAGSSPNEADIMYGDGQHNVNPTPEDVNTQASVYTP